MEAIGFLLLIFQWGGIRNMDLKHMLQIAIGVETETSNFFRIGDDGQDGRFPGREGAVEDVLTGLANEGEIE